jgi:N-acyl homoserine lactone hydrolase
MNWTVKLLNFGNIKVPLCNFAANRYFAPDGSNVDVYLPYLGFLLQKGDQNVLVDAGIDEKYIVDGKAWGGNPAIGGQQYVLDALKKEGLTPEDIDMVIYTHLHNDHTGAVDHFAHALNVFQKDEWANLLDPLPSQKIRGDYDMSIIPRMRKLKKVAMVEGDVDMGNGLKLIKTPGHTLGSQCVIVPTDDGPRIILGDLFHLKLFLHPQMTEYMVDDKGTVKQIDPKTVPPESDGPILMHSLVYDHYAQYQSYYKVLVHMPTNDDKYLLFGHEPSLVYYGI